MINKEQFEKRLEDISKLEDGWFDNTGKKISSYVIEMARTLMNQLVLFGMQYANVFPTFNGGIQLEWFDKQNNIVIEIQTNGEIKLLSLQYEKKEKEN